MMILLHVLNTGFLAGGHINPAVTLAMFLNRRISLLRCVLYIIVQVCGAMLGSVVLKGVRTNISPFLPIRATVATVLFTAIVALESSHHHGPFVRSVTVQVCALEQSRHMTSKAAVCCAVGPHGLQSRSRRFQPDQQAEQRDCGDSTRLRNHTDVSSKNSLLATLQDSMHAICSHYGADHEVCTILQVCAGVYRVRCHRFLQGAVYGSPARESPHPF